MAIISVIVPVYNAEQYLDRCVQSIVSQTFSDLEIILIDDGSKDNSGTLCDMWAKKDSRIHVIHQKNAGAGAARNRGLSIATGEYIGFVDSDDWIDLCMYAVLYKELRRNHADVAMANMKSSRSDSSKVKKSNTQYDVIIKNKDDMLHWFFRVNGESSSINSMCIKLISKKVLSSFSFKEGTICEDVYASFYTIMHAEKTVFIDKAYYNYFQNNHGVTKSQVTEKDLEYIRTYKNIYEEIGTSYPSLSEVAYLNYLRANFTILTKMRLYGYDHRKLGQEYREIKFFVRKNYTKLIKWKMPFSRKVLLTLVCL